MFGHSLDKYVNSTMRQTSSALGWSAILAERWSHAAGELPRLVPRETEVAIQLSGKTLVDRAGGGRREHTHGHRGTIWLCPAGIEEEYINVVEPMADCLHLFLPGQPFSETVQREFDIDPARAGLRYQAIDHDPFVSMIADQIVGELSNETGVGRLFVESLSVALSAHLLKNYSELGLARPMADKAPKPLDSRRLSRVVDFIDGNLDQDFTVLELAGIACMSVGHFTRSFRAATGRAPHAFVAERRLMLAKRRLRDECCSIEEIAFSAGFSSLANFSKAFRHSTGLSPSQFRARS
jgi:AraC family transcriptional regulator